MKHRGKTKRTKSASASPSTTLTGGTAIRGIIVRHVESYQSPTSEDSSPAEYSLLSIQHAASKLKEELESEILSACFTSSISLNRQEVGPRSILSNEINENRKSMEEAEIQILDAVLEVIQTVLATVVSSDTSSVHALRNASFYESTCRVLSFIAIFASMPSGTKGKNSRLDTEMCNYSLGRKVLDFVRQFAIVEMESTRVLICEFISHYIQNLSYHRAQARIENGKDLNKNQEEKDTSEECWKEYLQIISDILCSRLEDKSAAVRSAALESCSRLFEEQLHLRKRERTLSIVYDPIIKSMLFNLTHDTSLANRSLAVKSIPITEETIPLIIERVKDAKMKVRVDALSVLKMKVDVRDLSLEHRVDILRSGFTDRCGETYKATTQLLCSGWMKTVKFDPIETLRLIDPTTNEAISQLSANVMLSVGSTDYDLEGDQSLDKALVDLSQNEIQAYKEIVLEAAIPICENAGQDPNLLDPASILFLRVICDLTTKSKSMSEVKKANCLSRLMPDIPTLGDILEKNVGYLKQCAKETFEQGSDTTKSEEIEDNASFVCLQLLRLARVADMKEEGSRRHFSSIIHRMLCSSNTHNDLIEDCVLVASCCYDTESQFLLAIAEILADTIDMNESMSSSSQNIREQSFIRAMEILSVVFENISRKVASNPTFQNFSELILSAITDTRFGPLVREAGVSCLGRYTILLNENTIIETFKPLLMNVAFRTGETNEIRAQSMLNITDLAVLYDKMQNPILLTDINSVQVSISDLLLQTLSGSNKALVIIAAECAAKLLFAGKLHDANILALLIMIYFDRDFVSSDENEAADDVEEVGSPARLQQLLTLFFPAYCMRTKLGRDTLTASIQPLLVLINEKLDLEGKKQLSWPIAKMVEYICVTVDEGDNEEALEDSGDNDCEDEMEDPSTVNEIKTQGPSAVLVMAIYISDFLMCKGESIHLSYLRSLSKILGTVYVDIETEQPSSVHTLQSNLDDLAMIITDNNSLRSLKNLVQILEDFDINNYNGKSKPKCEEIDASDARISTESKDVENVANNETYGGRNTSDSGSDTETDNSESRVPFGKGKSLIEALERVDLNEKAKEDEQLPISTGKSNNENSTSNSASLGKLESKKFSAKSRKLRSSSNETDIPAFALIGGVDSNKLHTSASKKQSRNNNTMRKNRNNQAHRLEKTKQKKYSKDKSNYKLLERESDDKESLLKKKTSRNRYDASSIPIFASFDGNKYNEKGNMIDPEQDDLSESAGSISSNNGLSEDDSDADIIEDTETKDIVTKSHRGKRTSARLAKMQERITEDNVSISEVSKSSYDDDLSEDSVSESNHNKHKKVIKPRNQNDENRRKTKGRKTKTPILRRSKRKEITPLSKGRTPMRPRRKLADINY